MIAYTFRFALAAVAASASSVIALAPLVIRQDGCPQGPVQETATLTNSINGATLVVRQEYPATCTPNAAVPVTYTPEAASQPVIAASVPNVAASIVPSAASPVYSVINSITATSGPSVVTSPPQSSTVDMGESSLVGITTTDAFGHTVIVPSSLLSNFLPSSSSSASTSSLSTSTLHASSTGKPTGLNSAAGLRMKSWPGSVALFVITCGFLFL